MTDAPTIAMSDIFSARHRASELADKLLLAGYHTEGRWYHLHGLFGAYDQLRSCAEIMGFELVPIKPKAEPDPEAEPLDFEGEVPALRSAVL